MVIFGDFFASCVFSEPRAAGFRLHLKFALRLCVEVWQTSNLRRLRLGKEKKEMKKEQTTA